MSPFVFVEKAVCVSVWVCVCVCVATLESAMISY